MGREFTEREQIASEFRDLLQKNLQAIQNATFLGWTPGDRIAQEERLERILRLGKILGSFDTEESPQRMS